MWGSRKDRERDELVCIACGASISRAEAREYDKLGDRWDRHGKEFEHLCKSCYRDLCHQPRDELEDLLVEIEEEDGDRDRAEFLARYVGAVEERYGSQRER